MKKGNRVFVEGRYSTRSYDTPDGQRKYVTEVVANMIAVPLGMGGRSQTQAQDPGFTGSENYSQPKGNFSQFGDTHNDEDIPF